MSSRCCLPRSPTSTPILNHPQPDHSRTKWAGMDDNQSFHVPLNHEADQEQPHLPALQPHEVQANELEDQPLHHHLYLEKTGRTRCGGRTRRRSKRSRTTGLGGDRPTTRWTSRATRSSSSSSSWFNPTSSWRTCHGHPNQERFLRILRFSKANKEVMDAARKFTCSACAMVQEQPSQTGEKSGSTTGDQREWDCRYRRGVDPNLR